MLDVAPGTLGDSIKRFVPLRWAMQLPSAAASPRRRDELEGSRPRRGRRESPQLALGLPERCKDGPSRSAAAAQKLFGGLGIDEPVYLRSAYKKLARELPNHFVLAYCWVHVRRDFIGLGRPDMRPFGGVNRIGELCGRNAKRLQHWDSTANEQTAAFDEAQQELENETFFGQARQQIAALAEDAPQRKPLQSLLRHREGLEVMSQPPQWTTTLPNGPCAVPRRKLSFGSRNRSATGRAALFRAHWS